MKAAMSDVCHAVKIVLFSMENYRVGFEASQVVALHPITADRPEDPTKSIETVLGLTPTTQTTPRYALQFKPLNQTQEIILSGSMDLISLDIDAIHPLPPILAARTHLKGLRALTLPTTHTDQGVILLFDLLSPQK